ncbi:DNA double-strand break repair ATPase Rad50 [Halomarina salina]|uniref:DNA double-strand break repair Rad50 ATPase n=1 Tax=Halomarina salina TaxID=1872699 RepID=A0ABD5RHX6_9EURY|nr:DNA double-strand break repair ATPase Rad50 [Halomarina salina]
MRFERVRLENFKCYADADLHLDDGVTVMYGLNGSGKSSLLEACFFALYGAKALDTTLDEVVTIGAEETTVELWFAHGGERYHVERRIRYTGDRAQTATCLLETPDGPVEGARDVRGYVEDLLRMDAGAFVNCAYVRQGEVNKLINASPSQRQNMIDDLLQLGTLEEYRERASDARVGVGRVRDTKRGALDDVEAQISEKEAKNLHGRRTTLLDERTETDAEIERLETKREQAITTRDTLEERLDAVEERREELEGVEETIEELQSAIAETERERETAKDRLSELRTTVSELEEERDEVLAETDIDAPEADAVDERDEELADREDDLRSSLEEHRLTAQEASNTAETLRETVEDLESRASDAREEATELEEEVAETTETLDERREQVADLERDAERKREAFEEAPCAFGEAETFRERVAEERSTLRERKAALESDLKNANAAVEEAEELLAEGKCPECGQPVDGSPHVESIEERREQVSTLESELTEVTESLEAADDRYERAEELVEREAAVEEAVSDRENLEQLIEEREATVERERERVEELREEADRLETEAEAKRDGAEAADERAVDAREAIGELNGDLAEVRERRTRLDRLSDLVDDIDDAEEERERLRDRREELADVNDERREHLRERRERRDELRESFDEDQIEGDRENLRGAREFIEYVEPKLADLREERDELQSDVGAIENELDALDDLRERREELAATVERLDALYEETEELQSMYADLRAELRQRNVVKLESLLNETFDLVYQNDSYARIELDGDYELTVYQKDGEPLDPEQLSGGERALFNLSLRCAIYRLLAEGIEGAAPMPPLILDEPTVFLDAGHVSKLVELIGSMRDVGVEQIVVVSHDEELAGAADDLVHVEKNPTSNRSTVDRERELATLLAD